MGELRIMVKVQSAMITLAQSAAHCRSTGRNPAQGIVCRSGTELVQDSLSQRD